MKKIEVDSFSYNMPSQWADVEIKKAVQMHQLVWEYKSNKKKGIELLLLALGFSTKRKELKNPEVQNLLTLPAEWIHSLIRDKEFLGWMFSPNGLETYTLKNFWYKGQKYHGPARSILDLKTVELIAAYNRFLFYAQTEKEEHLNRLVALLYRPARPFVFAEKLSSKFEEDVRQKLNAWHWKQRTKKMEKLPMGTKLFILRQFSSEWAVFEKKRKNVFSQSKGSGKYDPKTWTKILLQLSGGAFGTLEQIKMHHCEEVFDKLEMDIVAALKLKDKNK